MCVCVRASVRVCVMLEVLISLKLHCKAPIQAESLDRKEREWNEWYGAEQ